MGHRRFIAAPPFVPPGGTGSPLSPPPMPSLPAGMPRMPAPQGGFTPPGGAQQATAPGTLPQSTLPQGTLPQSTLPQSTLPQGAVPYPGMPVTEPLTGTVMQGPDGTWAYPVAGGYPAAPAALAQADPEPGPGAAAEGAVLAILAQLAQQQAAWHMGWPAGAGGLPPWAALGPQSL